MTMNKKKVYPIFVIASAFLVTAGNLGVAWDQQRNSDEGHFDKGV